MENEITIELDSTQAIIEEVLPHTMDSPIVSPSMEERPNTVKKSMREFFTTKRMAYLGIFAALSAVLHIFAVFPIPGFPGFLEFKFSDIPALIAGFMLGPLSGAIVIVFRMILRLVTGTTGAAGVGEISDLLLGLTLVVTASMIYQKTKSTKGALVGLAIASVASIAVAVFVNRLITVPLFSLIFGWDAILGMVRPLYPAVTQETFYHYFLLYAVIPFNTIRVVVASGLAFGLYHALKKADKRLFPGKKKTKEIEN
ncbi:MAG: ECF transporter S component [Firmicutes bacterium]|nr:ECF transporter S component [Bacillota bacterium]